MQVLQCNKVLFGGYMNQYLIVSFQAVVLFPIVVAVFTLPYIASAVYVLPCHTSAAKP